MRLMRLVLGDVRRIKGGRLLVRVRPPAVGGSVPVPASKILGAGRGGASRQIPRGMPRPAPSPALRRGLTDLKPLASVPAVKQVGLYPEVV